MFFGGGGVGVGVEHLGYAGSLGIVGCGDDVDCGLNDACRKREPLREDERQEVAGVLATQVARKNFEVEGGDDLACLLGVAA